MVELTLPWPPTVNTYWRNLGDRVVISKRGRQYRRELGQYRFMVPGDLYDARLAVHILARVPDKRRRDLDNLLKSLLDAMQHADMYADDNQIDDLHIVRGEPIKHGQVIVTISAITN